MKKTFAVVLLLNFLVIALFAKTIVIYHTSDVHGWYNARPAKWYKKNPNRQIGGFASLGSLIKKEKNPFMLLDSGDWFQGTPEGTLTKGSASIKLMNKLKYTASTLGNHEYDFGEDNLKKILKKANFSVLAANVENKKTHKKINYAKPYIIKKIDGVKIAIIGLVNPDTKTSTFPPYVEHLNFLDPADTAHFYVNEIKHKVDAIIILIHDGLSDKYATKFISPKDLKLNEYDYKNPVLQTALKSKNDIAVILGGHYHTGLKEGYLDTKSNTLFVESGGNLTDVSKVALEFDDETNKFISAKSKLITLWIDETGENRQISKITEKIKNKVDKKLDKVIAFAKEDMLLSESKLDNSLGNWITDFMARKCSVKIAFQNTHGIRADIYKGEVTLRNLYQVLPFENTLTTLDLTGNQIIKLIRQNIRNEESFMQVSGIEILIYDKNKIEVMQDGKPIERKKTYKVVTNSYLTSGGFGGAVFLQGKNLIDTNINMRDYIIEYLIENPQMEKPSLGRIRKSDRK